MVSQINSPVLYTSWFPWLQWYWNTTAESLSARAAMQSLWGKEEFAPLPGETDAGSNESPWLCTSYWVGEELRKPIRLPFRLPGGGGSPGWRCRGCHQLHHLPDPILPFPTWKISPSSGGESYCWPLLSNIFLALRFSTSTPPSAMSMLYGTLVTFRASSICVLADTMGHWIVLCSTTQEPIAIQGTTQGMRQGNYPQSHRFLSSADPDSEEYGCEVSCNFVQQMEWKCGSALSTSLRLQEHNQPNIGSFLPFHVFVVLGADPNYFALDIEQRISAFFLKSIYFVEFTQKAKIWLLE